MKLIHYSAQPFSFDRSRTYHQDGHWKPRGLWLSVSGEHGWKEWCESEEWGTETLANTSIVELTESPNVLTISTIAELDAFDSKYGDGDPTNMRSIDWDRVKQAYHGLIISPYFWERRFHFMWYYGWDCASGVIWDLSAIKSAERIFKEEITT